MGEAGREAGGRPFQSFIRSISFTAVLVDILPRHKRVPQQHYNTTTLQCGDVRSALSHCTQYHISGQQHNNTTSNAMTLEVHSVIVLSNTTTQQHYNAVTLDSALSHCTQYHMPRVKNVHRSGVYRSGVRGYSTRCVWGESQPTMHMRPCA